jgi:alpha-N-acetylglucosamine transferase
MKKAYVTTLCNGDGYLPGVEALGKSLELSGSHEKRIVLVTSDISASTRERLSGGGWQVRSVDAIVNPAADHQLFPRFAGVFTKLRAFELVDLERVVLLDADTLVLQNVDDLFERPPIAAGPDFFLPDRFNSGVIVIEPSAATFGRMMGALAAAQTYDGGDQGFLNTFFGDWYAMPVAHRLPVGYNMAHFIYQFLRGHPTLRATLEREAKIIHYMVQKPWQAKATLTGGAEAWWKMYFQAHPEKAKTWKGGIHAFEDWTFDHVVSFVLGR